MNTKKTAITIVAAMMAIAMITTAVMATDCHEPCGTKIEQCTGNNATKDAVYALILPGVTGVGTVGAVPSMAFAFHDDGDGIFEPIDGECAYIDTNWNGGVGTLPNVEAGDIRLIGHCGQNPNNPVLVCDPNEIGSTLFYPLQTIVGYADDGNGYYDIDDLLYLDVGPLAGVVSTGDIRLTGYSGFGQTYDSYSYVNSTDVDAVLAFPLFDPANNALLPQLNLFNDYLGFVDTACDNMWDNRTNLLTTGEATGEDKLYLQQIVIGEPGGARNNLPLNPNQLYPFDGFVTIGDFRIYMPPNEQCWPECGTKVEQCAPDAEYPLLIPNVDIPLTTGAVIPSMALRWVDATQDGSPFDASVDDVYIDVNNGVPGLAEVENGDVRLTDACGCPPNTLAGQCDDCDDGAQFAPMVPPAFVPHPIVPPSDQHLVGFVDTNVNGRYDLDDALYLDTSRLADVAGGGVGQGVGVVSVNDIRLTPRGSYAAYSVVVGGPDLTGDITLRDIAIRNHPALNANGGNSRDPINSYLGFVDSNCDGDWDTNGEDKLYLQQMVFEMVDPDPRAPAMNQLDRFASIGDFRLYMPLNEDCWPDCGTKVEQCDVDAVYGLMLGVGAAGATANAAGTVAGTPGTVINGAVPAMNIVVTNRNCVYVNVYGHAVGNALGPGAVRLIDCCDNKSNTVVKDCDCDANDIITATAQNILGYVDVNSNGVYDMEDPLYLDLGVLGLGGGSVSAGDIRLTPRECQGHYYDEYTRVVANDWDAGHGSGIGDVLQCPKRNFQTGVWPNPTVNWFLGFIDSNCDGKWAVDGSDKLYLQQMVPAPVWWAPAWFITNDPQFNLFSTIGDDRLYMPPTGGIVTPDCPADLSSATYGVPDGTVDIYDIAYVIDNWGQSGSSADVSGSTYGTPDGTVDIYDIAYVIDNWGDC